MSNWHALKMDKEEDGVRVAFHIPIPDENNSASVNLRIALKQWLEEDLEIGSQVPWITTEITDIQSGALYEHVTNIKFDANLTLAQKRTIIDGKYTTYSTSIVDRIRSEFKFWGMDRDVP